MSDTFLTIDIPAEGLFKEKGSKFIAYAYPVTNELEVKVCVDNLKKEFFDARHHCFAYILGADKSKTRANDDGEPAHSAGTPILNQIKSSGLTNVLVVVVRYFGGTKLGVPCLINAYKLATADALNKVLVVEKIIEEEIDVKVSFEGMNEVLKLVKQFDGHLLTQDFSESDCSMKLSFRKSIFNQIVAKIEYWQLLGMKIEIIE